VTGVPTWVFLLFGLLLTACGVKTPLISPDMELPKAVNGFEVRIRGEKVLMTWRAPAEKHRAEISGYRLFYQDVTADRQRGCNCRRFQDLAFVDLDTAEIIDGRLWLVRNVDPAWWGRLQTFVVVPVSSKGFAGEESEERTVLWTPAPPPPLSVTAKPGNRTVTLQWTAPQGEGLRYRVYRRSAKKSFPLQPVNAVPLRGTLFQDGGLQNGTPYFYVVRSVASDGPPWIESEAAPEVSVIPVDRVAPAAPRGVEVIAGRALVRIFWEENTEPDLAGYRVYRRAAGEEHPLLLGEVKKPGTTFTDSSVSAGVGYEYTVTAYDDAPVPNESRPSRKTTVVAQ